METDRFTKTGSGQTQARFGGTRSCGSCAQDFMADFARGGRAGNESAGGYHYQLGPPIMNSAEHGDKLQLPLGCGGKV
jgi:hypothetical protein